MCDCFTLNEDVNACRWHEGCLLEIGVTVRMVVEHCVRASQAFAIARRKYFPITTRNATNYMQRCVVHEKLLWEALPFAIQCAVPQIALNRLIDCS